MSKVAKKVGKVFKKVGKALKKVVKPLAIAVAAYFTAGVALSFIPATASFAASLPGFAGGGIAGTGLGAGATAGTGIFSKAASAIGLGGGIQGSSAVQALQGASQASKLATMNSMGAAQAGATGAGAGSSVAAGITGEAAKAAGMSLTDKLLFAKIGTDVAGALFGPTEEDMIRAQKQFSGSFYGMTAGGQTAAPVQAPTQEAPQAQQPQQGGARGDLGIDHRKISEGRERAQQLFANIGTEPVQEEPENPALFGEGQMKQQIQMPENVFSPSPGVRYV